MSPGTVLGSETSRIFLENKDERPYFPSCDRHAVSDIWIAKSWSLSVCGRL